MNGTLCASWIRIGQVIAIAFAAWISSASFGQTILYVDDDAPPGGDGLSWDTAFDDLQDALDVGPGKDGVEIRVGQGTYVPSLRTDPQDPRSATFRLANNTTLLGGFAGHGYADPNDHDVVEYETFLEGDLDNNDGPDFANNSENAYNVLSVVNAGDTPVVVNGFTIRGGNANVPGNPGQLARSYVGGGCYFDTSTVQIEYCRFTSNNSGVGAAIGSYTTGVLHVTDSIFHNNIAGNGAIAGYTARTDPKPLWIISNCRFYDNAGVSGSCISTSSHLELQLSNCDFNNNSAIGGGGVATLHSSTEITSCHFVSNHCDLGSGGVSISGNSTIMNSTFSDNQGWFGGAVLQFGFTQIINCTISHNNGDFGGGIFAAGALQLVNCSIANNIGSGIQLTNTYGELLVKNSIVRGNTTAQIDEYFGGPPQLAGINATVFYTNIQGGWNGPGSNNIDADPLFIQPGCGNLRLGIGSPCIDAGDNSAIPSGITTDLDGNPRIINGIVDMGAYEGEHEMLPPAACANDIDPGLLQLVPEGGPFDPLLKPAVTIVNEAQNNAYAIVTQYEAELHSSAGGFNELGSELSVETSLLAGGFWMRVFINFDQSNLNGFDPLEVDLTYFNPTSDAYELAAASNIQNSPDHNGPLGDRHVIVGSSWQGQLSFEIGDYGVFWNPDEQKGFVWANVDHASDFAFGVPLPECVGDCTYPSDGAVNVFDLTIVLDNWGIAPAGPASFADITRNGIVDVDDLLALILAWGACK